MSAIDRARNNLDAALVDLMMAMTEKPGPYPDPACPIGQWQSAHEHLQAARFLLSVSVDPEG